MALTNAQYDLIMGSYQARKLRNEKAFRKKLEMAYQKYPRLDEIDEEIAKISLRKARIKLGVSSEADFDLDAAIHSLSEEKSALFQMAGFPEGKAEVNYDCPYCKDSGLINGRKCSCFRQAELSLLYSQSHLAEILETENFDTFSLEWYSRELKDPATKLSARDTAKKAYDYAKYFSENFSGGGNICFFGKTGVGKTFLSHCIAKELMDRGFSVLYLTASGLFHALEENTFRSTPESRENVQLIYDCDLLILDDLGANFNNSFVSSQLFQCINERALLQKSIIISTNLSLSELRDAYSDRVVSRIMSSYQRLYLFGEDIRIQKKLKKGASNGTEK